MRGVAACVEAHRDDAPVDDVVAMTMVGDHRLDFAAQAHDGLHIVLRSRGTRGEPRHEHHERTVRAIRRS